MRIYYEKLYDDHYIELCLTQEEADSLSNQSVVSKECEFEERPFFFGARLLTDEEIAEDKDLF